MKHICLLLLFLLAVTTSLMAQSPVKRAFAYSRHTIRGTPDNDRAALSPQNIFPTSYFIYVVVKSGTVISVRGVCLQGKWHAATLKRVDSPVLIDHDVAAPTGKQDTLVKRTSDDVYQVQPEEQEGADCKDHAEDKLAQSYEVVVSLTSSQSSWYALVRKVVPLHPAAAM